MGKIAAWTVQHEIYSDDCRRLLPSISRFWLMFLGRFFLFNIFTEHPQCSSWYLKFVLFVICIFFLIITKCLLNYPSGDRDWYCSALALFSSKTSLHSCNAKKIIAFIQGGPSTLSRSREEFLHSSKTNTTVYSVHHFLCSSDIKSDQNIVYVFIFKNILVPYINLKKKTPS